MSNLENQPGSTHSQDISEQESNVTPDLQSDEIVVQTTVLEQEQPKSSTPGFGYATILQFVFSLAAILSLWGIAALLLLLGVISLTGMSWNPAFILQSVSLAACGFMVLPSAITSFRRMRGRPLPEDYRPLLNLNPLIPALILLPVLGIGYLALNSELAWLIMPVIHVLAISLPVLFLVILGVRGLPTGSPQRRSGVFGVGVSLGPFVILILESLALVAAILVVAIYISNQPDLMGRLTAISEDFSRFQGDIDELLELLAPFLTNTLIVTGVLVFVAVIVPLIEEMFKPIGVWFILGRRISPAEGFAAGALSGAGFAVFESLMLNASLDEWLVGSVVRIGTAVIHITTAAFSGWALALARQKGRYLTLALTYLGVVAIHGLWNGMAILTIFNELAVSEGLEIQFPGLETIAVISPYILVGLTVFGLLAFLAMNRSLRHPVENRDKITSLE